MDREPDIVLASASPRRRELLERLGLALVVLPADVDETPAPAERPADYAKRIAGAKCDAVAATRDAASPTPIVGADTIVVVDDRILGKPADEAGAREMLTALAGRRHEVLTAYRIRTGDRMLERIVTTTVSFRALRPAELEAYLASGEWRGKAGGYAVQGIAAVFATELRGSVTNVIGLPIAELLADLQAMDALPGYPPPGFGDPVTRAEEITDGLARVRGRVAAAEQAAGRSSGSVRLVAVSKKMTADDVRAALAAGQRLFGESYGQELRDKRAALAGDAAAPEWHFVGPLQGNKVKYVAGQVALVHSVDSIALAEAIEARAELQACLVQVNIAGEAGKHGVTADALAALLDRFATFTRLRCAGLMLIPPLAARPEEARPHFAALRALRDVEQARGRPNVDLAELSMGMSADLEIAIAEGATLVRVGTAIFGRR